MGLRYRKSIKLGKHTRLNLSGKGVGVSVGGKGFRVSSGPRGTRMTTSIPGTGVSYSTKVGGRKKKKSSNDGCLGLGCMGCTIWVAAACSLIGIIVYTLVAALGA